MTKNNETMPMIENDQTTEQPPDNYLETLKEKFGFNKFRSGQWKIISALLQEKRDVCGILPTGQGKSLCYQFPAVLTNKTSVVISPLISLMQDQKMSLTSKGISCEIIKGSMSYYLETMEEVIRGEYAVVYTTPEFIHGNYGFLHLMFEKNTLGLIAIDEAHCISAWGHDFRPSYRKLKDLRKEVPDVPMLALTATATPTITEDLCNNLKLKNPKLVRNSVDRPNLHLFVRKKTSGSGGLLADLTEILGKPTKDGMQQESAIIYTNSRKDCEKIHEALTKAGHQANYYHAGLADIRRKKVHEDFIYDRCNLVVATIAFGMGIDKPNIRKIINWGLPSNLETYYQEIGRAGRDSLDSECYLIYSSADLHIHKFLIEKMECSREVQEHHLHLLYLMLNWAQSHVCRQYQIAYYFEKEQLVLDNPPESEQEKFCGNCDICLDRKNSGKGDINIAKIDIGADAQLMYKLVDNLYTNYGFRNLIGILTGTKAKTFPVRLKKNIYYNQGSHRSQTYWKALSDLLIDHGYLKYTKIGGMSGRSTSNNKVYQVVNIGDKEFKLDDQGKLLVVPNEGLKQATKNQKHYNDEEDEIVISIRGMVMTKLKEFRQVCSQKLRLPPYIVLPDPVINNLLQFDLPIDINQVAMVDGMHPRVVMEMGEELIESINSCAPKQRAKSTTKTTTNRRIVPQTSILNDSQEETLKLYRLDHSLEEIATIRKMNVRTIEDHLVKIIEVGTDNIKYDNILSDEHRQIIDDYLDENPSTEKLRPIKDGLKTDNITYLEIKIAIAVRASANKV